MNEKRSREESVKNEKGSTKVIEDRIVQILSESRKLKKIDIEISIRNRQVQI